MPLLCISLLALLLLPLSLSCDSKRPPEEVSEDYVAIVETDLNNTRENITTLLQNPSCPPHKLPNCTLDNVDFVSTLHILNCKMKNLRLSHTDGLFTSVQNSIRCSCLEKPTKGPNMQLKRRRTAMRQRRNEQKKSKRETKKLCKAKAILSAMTKCYEMLNTEHLRPNSSIL